MAPYATMPPQSPADGSKLLIEYRSLRDEGMVRFFRRMVRSREDILKSQWASLSKGSRCSWTPRTATPDPPPGPWLRRVTAPGPTLYTVALGG